MSTNRISTIFATLFCTITLSAQTVLFKTTPERNFPYRIPAIAKMANGTLLAVADYRPCLRDIGFGRVDLVMRTSNDNGKSWTSEEVIIEGTGKGQDAGYGDACLVADRHRNEFLIMCVSGDINYFESSLAHPQRVMALHASYDKQTKQWKYAKTDLTSKFYQELFHNRINGMFMSSGRICQSRQVKVGAYYRLYAALCTHKGNFVVYSDDFGYSWNVLGSSEESCVPKGDEVKCEELPDGSLIVSSRKDGGRYFNIFRFTDRKKALGAWDQAVDSRDAEGGIANTGTPCNGELLLIPARNMQTGADTYLLLQSIPAGEGRKNVSVYYKDMGALLKTKKNRITSLDVASHWDGVYQVSYTNSAYSTMCLQADRRVAFFYEEAPKDYHELTYLPLDIRILTRGKYTVRKW